MPQDYPTNNPFEALYRELDELRKRIAVLEKVTIATIPIYDWEDQPQDAVEGQIALFVNTPEVS